MSPISDIGKVIANDWLPEIIDHVVEQSGIDVIMDYLASHKADDLADYIRNTMEYLDAEKDLSAILDIAVDNNYNCCDNCDEVNKCDDCDQRMPDEPPRDESRD